VAAESLDEREPDAAVGTALPLRRQAAARVAHVDHDIVIALGQPDLEHPVLVVVGVHDDVVAGLRHRRLHVHQDRRIDRKRLGHAREGLSYHGDVLGLCGQTEAKLGGSFPVELDLDAGGEGQRRHGA